MGVNNRQRRASKQRKRARERTTREAFTATSSASTGSECGPDPDVALAHADLLVTRAVRALIEAKGDAARARGLAERTLRQLAPVPVRFLGRATEDLLMRLVDSPARGGWGPGDLGELVRRRGGQHAVGVLAHVLVDYAGRETWPRASWLIGLDELGPATPPDADTVDGLAVVLQVAALLAIAPQVEGPTSTAGTSTTVAHPKLARVRALLAKAESTAYDEEAEALSAKAQELISRYSLERLLEEHEPGEHEGSRVAGRRIWLDAPYVLAKSQLVHEVADANRCRALVTEELGFCLVIGPPADLDAVELLVTSLLVQANTAMLRHGRSIDAGGASRTRSFRQSFLVAYAVRIGDRLRSAAASAVRQSGEEARLLPVLHDQRTRVDEAFTAMAPNVVTKSVSATNNSGWAAGRAAAELALLDVHGQITDAGLTPRR